MNKTQLIDIIADKGDINKAKAKSILDIILEAITNCLKEGDTMQLVGFGTFKVNQRQARTGRNPQTGKPLEIAASNSPAFVSGKTFKEAVNKVMASEPQKVVGAPQKVVGAPKKAASPPKKAAKQ
ncbi:HU family DNA-binding protein [Candidatus Fukatsuia symbiotica]|uniref:HU family DNA-binding protein n=1 Tax=Candidatus Fukatsuia symbiotica TaxID=1878942 RepID=A0A2U8I6J6_9GAMM|nr:HU family DNA-binding protein [Candidatus Fukatsuia symbiotica]